MCRLRMWKSRLKKRNELRIKITSVCFMMNKINLNICFPTSNLQPCLSSSKIINYIFHPPASPILLLCSIHLRSICQHFLFLSFSFVPLTFLHFIQFVGKIRIYLMVVLWFKNCSHENCDFAARSNPSVCINPISEFHLPAFNLPAFNPPAENAPVCSIIVPFIFQSPILLY